MRVLGIDTTQDACQAAVIDGARVLATLSEPMQRGHQERLATLVAQAMAESGLGFDALERIGVTVGPGSFTGLRVGLAFAKGLALALAVPCVGVSTLQALVAGRQGKCAAVLDARRDQVYLQLFEGDGSRSDPMAVSIPEAVEHVRTFAGSDPIQLLGPGAVLIAESVQGALTSVAVDPATVARLAARSPAPLGTPRPIYLRAPDARLPA